MADQQTNINNVQVPIQPSGTNQTQTLNPIPENANASATTPQTTTLKKEEEPTKKEFYVTLKWRDFLAATEDLMNLKIIPQQNLSLSIFFQGLSSVALNKPIRDRLSMTIWKDLKFLRKRFFRLFYFCYFSFHSCLLIFFWTNKNTGGSAGDIELENLRPTLQNKIRYFERTSKLF